MELWFSEIHTENVKLNIKVEKQIASLQSDYQRIDVFYSAEYGIFLALDGYLMLTQKDEFIYHEMMTHIPMVVHPNPKKVLVIGGGDGGVLRELIKYPFLEEIDLAEIDPAVVEICKKHLPFTACGFEDKRVKVFFQDGLRFIRRIENHYDLIIVDSTDPFGPGEGLFTKEFYGNCSKALKEDGILVNQHESPFYENDAKAAERIHKRLYDSFDISKVYQAHIPSYPSGHWLFGFSSNTYHPLKNLNKEKWEQLKIATGYYNTVLHQGAFCLPTYVLEALKWGKEKQGGLR